ncbi:MAG: rhomboid family intramembrane serine protease [Candidatus Hydrogenedentales bacterium]
MSSYEQNYGSSGFVSDRITWGVRLIILSTTAVFAAQLLLAIPFGGVPGFPGEQIIRWLSFSPANFADFMVWQPVTYMFLHSGLMHLFLNMLMLFFFGPEVERILGSRQFLWFYILRGAVGVLANFVPVLLASLFGSSDTGWMIQVIGASGATLGVLVAFAIVEPDRQVFMFPFPFPITVRALVILIIIINIVSATRPGPVSVATHFGGLITGYVYMKFRPSLTNWQVQRGRSAERRLRRRAWRLRNPFKRRSSPSKKDLDQLGEEIDNIFRFHDRDRNE